eukprot:185223-Karenia_brevis.AAC.2
MDRRDIQFAASGWVGLINHPPAEGRDASLPTQLVFVDQQAGQLPLPQSLHFSTPCIVLPPLGNH